MSPSTSRSQQEDDRLSIKANDERTPLLAAVASSPLAEAGEAEVSANEAHHDTQAEDSDEAKHLNFSQIFLLCYTRVFEPIAFFSIFPYINSMIEKTGGVAKEDVGFYSGLIESLFSLTQITKDTQARVFSYFAFAGNVGGALERPAVKFPSMFGNVRFFNDYPYALPGFVCSFVGLSAALLVTFYVKETLHVHHGAKRATEPSLTWWDVIKSPGVAKVMLIYNYCMLLAFAFTAAFPVFMYTPIHLGGLQLSPEWISVFMAIGGASQAFWLLVVFPPLHKRIGTGGLLKFNAFIWPIFFASNPLCNILLRHGLKVPFWILFPFNNIFGSSVAMAFTGVQLALNDISPSHESFGTLNALVLALQSGIRAIIPAASTTLYAIGVKYHILLGQLFWLVIVLVAIGFNFVTRLLPEKAQGRPKPKTSHQGEEEAFLRHVPVIHAHIEHSAD
ncbi:hypothetical protein SLS60_006567 [Paraconiothyrium brasiliense]|uniref:MFS transporter n=1 Tax=Paraconiothyrium brasiliense TaxID=300254 RepID=A0ABR3RBB8_9PLEO